jgi:hypothetical protein
MQHAEARKAETTAPAIVVVDQLRECVRVFEAVLICFLQ